MTVNARRQHFTRLSETEDEPSQEMQTLWHLHCSVPCGCCPNRAPVHRYYALLVAWFLEQDPC